VPESASQEIESIPTFTNHRYSIKLACKPCGPQVAQALSLASVAQVKGFATVKPFV